MFEKLKAVFATSIQQQQDIANSVNEAIADLQAQERLSFKLTSLAGDAFLATNAQIEALNDKLKANPVVGKAYQDIDEAVHKGTTYNGRDARSMTTADVIAVFKSYSNGSPKLAASAAALGAVFKG